MPDRTTAQPGPSGRDAAPAGDDPSQRVIVEELERRLALLESADEEAFGRFGALDWLACIAGFVVLPLLLVWWAA